MTTRSATNQKSWQSEKKRSQWIKAILLTLAILIFILPLAWTFLATWGVIPDDTNSPPVWTWPPVIDNYLQIGVAEPGFLIELATSLSISIMATVFTILVGFLAAYSLARSPSQNVRAGVQAFLILACLPVMAYVIPLSNTVSFLHLYDTWIGVALANTAIFSPLAVYILYGYFRDIPADLEEAARLDGASIPQILWQVVVPAVASGIGATAIILFVLNWNLLIVPMVLTESHVKTIPVAMSDFFTFERELEWPVAAAVLIISLTPLVALVALAHRLLERFILPVVRS